MAEINEQATPRYPGSVAKIFDALRRGGHIGYIVGGSVRDTLLGRPVHDWDMTTDATPDEMLSVFRGEGFKVIPTGIKHGTLTVIADGEPIEITTFRIDGSYSDGRHPDSVSFSRRLGDDLCRRDFTVNAMAYSDIYGFVDLFEGQADLSRGLIRCVGVPEERFGEDALRILRAFRFAAKLGFTIEGATLSAAKRLAPELAKVSAERKAVELMGLVSSPDPEYALSAADDAGVLCEVLGATPERSNFARLALLPPVGELRLSALLYGLPPEAIEATLVSLKYSNAIKRTVKTLTSALPPEAAPAEIRRFIARYNERAEAALELLSVFGRDVTKARELLCAERERRAPLSLAELAVNGKDLMDAGLARGKRLKEVLAYLLDAVLDDPEKNTRDALLELAKKYKDEN